MNIGEKILQKLTPLEKDSVNILEYLSPESIIIELHDILGFPIYQKLININTWKLTLQIAPNIFIGSDYIFEQKIHIINNGHVYKIPKYKPISNHYYKHLINDYKRIMISGTVKNVKEYKTQKILESKLLEEIVIFCGINNIRIPNYTNDVNHILNVAYSGNHRI